MKKEKIAIIGAGNLGVAIGKGIVEKEFSEAGKITLTRRNLQDLSSLEADGFKVTNNNAEAVANAGTIVLCVQPNQLKSLVEEIKPSLKNGQIIVSVITGVSLDALEAYFGSEVTLIRAMPNTAISIGESMTCIAFSNSGNETITYVENLFGALGKTLVIEEELMQAATVLGASGIAFFMRYLRAATQGGIQMGFDAKDAQLIAVQTAKGAASLILEKKSHPEVEIDRVTTPQGCTIAGLNEMEHKGFSSALIQGIMTSFQRITNMISKTGVSKEQ